MIINDGADAFHTEEAAETGGKYERMWERLNADTARAMLQLLDEFPEATVQDWHLVFVMLRPGGPPWWPDAPLPIDAELIQTATRIIHAANHRGEDKS